MPRRILLFALMLPAPFFGTGCSLVVAEGGKDVHRLLVPGRSRSAIDRSLGNPISQEHFASPLVPPHSPSTIPATDSALYEYHGRVKDPLAFEALGMLVGMTFGLGEVVAFPESLKMASQMSKITHHYKVWYSADGTYLSHTHEEATPQKSG